MYLYSRYICNLFNICFLTLNYNRFNVVHLFYRPSDFPLHFSNFTFIVPLFRSSRLTPVKVIRLVILLVEIKESRFPFVFSTSSKSPYVSLRQFFKRLLTIWNLLLSFFAGEWLAWSWGIKVTGDNLN